MDTWQRRTVYYFAGLLAMMLAFAVVYDWGMATFEREPATFLHSIQVVVETFTTTGFGSDAPWTTPEMNLFVILMDLTGVLLIFLALPTFIFPLMEEMLATAPPTRVEDLDGHVVVCAYTAKAETLIEELDVLGTPYLVIEPERDLATDLYEGDVPVVHGDPEAVETLENANLEAARALVADIDDETNASVALAADQVAPDVPVITFAENPDVADYHRYAGADRVFSPRQLVAESLANKVTTDVKAELGEAIEIGEDFEIVELPVQAGSELAGVRVADSGVRERTGANIVGAWFRGEFVSPPSPDAYIDERTVLLVAGREAQLERLQELTRSEGRRRARGTILVGGHGLVGAAVARAIEESGLPHVVVDIEDEPGVDVVGDVTDEATLRRAGIEDASAVILALSDDTLTVFATLVVRELSPEVEIVARADETESVRKLYRAGADYVLAVATVSGRMLASTILGEDVISFDKGIEVVRVDAGPLAGQTLDGADIRARTGCTVIAVERDGEVITELDPSFRIQAGDDLVVAGTDDGVTEFYALVD